MNQYKTLMSVFLLTLAGLLLSACNEQKPEAEITEAVETIKPFELYEAHVDGRITVFYDHDLYRDFLQMGETPYRKTFIGEGPKGETLVYGLTKADKSKTEGISSIDLMQGKITAPDNFYGEMYLDGRIYVFDNYEQMVSVRAMGEPPYRYTMIGAGPAGETVVLVLRSDNKKQFPQTLQQAFKAHNGQ